MNVKQVDLSDIMLEAHPANESRADWARKTIINFVKSDYRIAVITDWHNNAEHNKKNCDQHYQTLKNAIYKCNMSGAVGVFPLKNELYLVRANAITKELLDTHAGSILENQFSRDYINAIQGLGLYDEEGHVCKCHDCCYLKEHPTLGQYTHYCEQFGKLFDIDNYSTTICFCPHFEPKLISGGRSRQ